MIHNINRRKFIELFGCGCCSLILPSCTTVPITERKQLSIYPEATINRQASAAYETFRSKTKLINSGKELETIKDIGKELNLQFLLSLQKKMELTLLATLNGITY